MSESQKNLTEESNPSEKIFTRDQMILGMGFAIGVITDEKNTFEQAKRKCIEFIDEMVNNKQ